MFFYFTPTGHAKLLEEISRIEGRLKSVQSQGGELAEVGGNAWHDNAGYEQMVIDLRGVNAQLSKLQEIKNHATIRNIPNELNRVAIGTFATINLNGFEEKFGIVGYQQSDPDRNLIAYDTPLAKLIIGLAKGERRETKFGQQKMVAEIVEIEALTPEREKGEL